jgi:hypothetical protein
MAEGLQNWKPHSTHVQGGLRHGNFLNAKYVLIAAGPPFYNQVGFPAGAGADANLAQSLVFPIGLTQNLSWSQNKSISRIFEIGSDRSYFISGRSVGSVSFGRIMYHGPSLLRCLYAYYDTRDDANVDAFQVPPLFESGGVGTTPFLTGAANGISPSLHSVRIPPGHDNMFLNLASDLFSQPLGLLLLLKDNELNTISATYLEQCYVPQHSMAMDSQGLIIQESVGIQYERSQSIRLAQLQLIDTFTAPDASGGFAGARAL